MRWLILCASYLMGYFCDFLVPPVGEHCLVHHVMDLCKVAKHVCLEILFEKLCNESYYALVQLPSLLPGLNADLATEGWSYFHLKCPCVYLCGTALFLSTFIVQMGLPCPLRPIKVMTFFLWSCRL